ncbi:DUF4112 domain-containing protein [bacterium]|nr:DUF4112 domain-containing protein [bacterium]
MANNPKLKWIERMTFLLDSEFRIPGTEVRFGLDPVIGLFPIIGDLVSYVISALLVFTMAQNGISGKLLLKMLANIFIDLIISGIPMAGQIGDFFYKANNMNLKLYKEYLEEGKHRGSAAPVLLVALLLLIALPIVFGIMVFYTASTLYHWIFNT